MRECGRSISVAGVVGMSGEDGEGAVELLGEHDAGEFVREGHETEGEGEGGVAERFLRPAVGGADGEVEMLDAGVAFPADPGGELLGGEGAAARIEEDELRGSAGRFFEGGEEGLLGGEVLLVDGGVVGKARGELGERLLKQARLLTVCDGGEGDSQGEILLISYIGFQKLEVCIRFIFFRPGFRLVIPDFHRVVT
jgi:hypothetical protein